MHSILSMTWIFLFSLLVGNSLAFDGCYSGGNTWEELGDDAAISDAFHSLCDKMSGSFKIGDNIVNCENINGHHIQAAIWPQEGPNGQKFGQIHLSLEGCVDYMTQIKNRCPDRGGELTSLETNPDSDGGDWVKSQVKADPEDGTKHC